MKYVFGKSLEYSFIPAVEGEHLHASTLVSARIYADNPTTQQIDNLVAGHIQEVTTWRQESEHEKIITFAPLSDPTPHESGDTELYYVVVNFKFEASAETKFITESILVYRPDALTSKIRTTFFDVIATEPKIENLYSPSEIERYIREAKKDIFRKYRGLGYEKQKMLDLEELNDACKYLSTAYACLGLFGESTPHWREKYALRIKQYEEVFNAARPKYSNGSDVSLAPTLEGGKIYIAR